ncbi:MAG TPA: protein YgfX [Burkholderiales bacterium]|nr:protein YgfX [Burkholderiales bacterium]
MRSGLRAARGASDADPRGAVELLRFRRHQRHAYLQTDLTNALHLSLRRPAALCAAVSFMHAAALACAVPALTGWPLALVAAGVALSWIAQWQRLWAQDVDLECRPDGGVALAGRARTLVGSALPLSWLAVIRLRDRAGHCEALVITPDRVDAAAFRRLRVWLRWHRRAPSGASE